MSSFLTLMKVQLLSFFGVNKVLNSKKGKISGLSGLAFVLVGLGVLIGALGYIYTDALAIGVTSKEEVLGIMLAYAIMISLFLSFYTAGNLLYGFKDAAILFSMPLKTSSIVFSKILVMYLSDIAFTICFMIGVVIKTSILAVDVLLKLFVTVLFAPIIPLALIMFLGLIVTVISSYFRKRNLVQTIIYLLLIGALVAYSLIDENGMTNIGLFISEPIQKAWQGWGGIALLILIALSCGGIVGLLVCATYKKVNSLVSVTRTKKGFKLKKYDGRSVFVSLYLKEIKTLFSCAVYVMNSVVGPVISILLAVILSLFEGITGIYAILPIVYCFAYMLAPTTNCAISMEGNTFWILKTSPVSMRKLLNVKLAVGITFNVIPAIIASTILSINIGGGFLICALNVLTALSIAIFGVLIGLTFNVLFPVLNWESPNKPVKQSLSVFLTMIVAFIFTVLSVLFMVYSPFDSERVIYHVLIIFGVTVLFSIACYLFISLKGEEILLKK